MARADAFIKKMSQLMGSSSSGLFSTSATPSGLSSASPSAVLGSTRSAATGRERISTVDEDFPPLQGNKDAADMKGKTRDSLFCNAIESKLQFHAPVLCNGRKIVQISKATHELGKSLWENCLIGQFFGPAPKISQIEALVSKLWGGRGTVDVIAGENEGFLFKFESKQSMPWALEGGPWYIANMPLLLQKWVPGFNFEKLSTSKIPLWVKLRKVPLELFTCEGLSQISSAIGNPLYLDRATEHRLRVDFARVCIEVDSGEELPSSIEVDIEGVGKVDIIVEYPWKPTVCAICKKFGHHDQTCTGVKEVWKPNKSRVQETADGFVSETASTSEVRAQSSKADGDESKVGAVNVTVETQPTTNVVESTAAKDIVETQSTTQLVESPVKQTQVKGKQVVSGALA